ncbi:MAG: alpha/beta hydrolase [Gemmatimonadales bacterium]
MNPAFFGTGGRRLFGIYHAPPADKPSDRGMVMCPPWGLEYLMSHRSLRQLALMLSVNGVHVLRFDYFGTGDSAGDASQASLAGCEADIDTAIDELMEISRVKQVGLVGLRLGADLAARVCARRQRPFRELVLWDPVVHGRDYRDEMRPRSLMSAPKPGQPAAPEAREHGGGFAMSDAFLDELTSVDLLALIGDLPERTLLATTERRPVFTQTAQPIQVQTVHVDSPSAWREQGNLGTASIPADLLQSIVGWLIE